MSGPTISLGLSGRSLKNKDFLGKSDPFIMISRPVLGGGFKLILTSETKKVYLVQRIIKVLTHVYRTPSIQTGMTFFLNKKISMAMIRSSN